MLHSTARAFKFPTVVVFVRVGRSTAVLSSVQCVCSAVVFKWRDHSATKCNPGGEREGNSSNYREHSYMSEHESRMQTDRQRTILMPSSPVVVLHRRHQMLMMVIVPQRAQKALKYTNVSAVLDFSLSFSPPSPHKLSHHKVRLPLRALHQSSEVLTVGY